MFPPVTSGGENQSLVSARDTNQDLTAFYLPYKNFLLYNSRAPLENTVEIRYSVSCKAFLLFDTYTVLNHPFFSLLPNKDQSQTSTAFLWKDKKLRIQDPGL